MNKKDTCVEKNDSKEIIKEIVVEKKIGFNFLEVIIIMIITVVFGFLVGSFVVRTKYNTINNNVSVPTELQEFVSTYEDILNNYYDNIDQKSLLDAGIKGMIDYLDDPYANFFDITESEAFNEQVNGEYIGIGTEISFIDGKIILSNVFADSPANRAGLMNGDVIVAVDSKSVEGLSSSEVSSLIRGKAGSVVRVKVLRDDAYKEVDVVRGKVEITSVKSTIFEQDSKKVGYISMKIFAANSYEQFKRNLEELEAKGIDSLIIDVRGNSGGYLSVVTDIMSLFLDKKQIIYQLETKGVKVPVYSKNKDKKEYPVAVLINSYSASASEILAAAFKESYNADIIGTNSYGKGTVQKAFSLQSGSTIKYTIQKWLTPNGNWVNDTGVEPTIYQELGTDYLTNPIKENDLQLQKAIQTLIGKME